MEAIFDMKTIRRVLSVLAMLGFAVVVSSCGGGGGGGTTSAPTGGTPTSTPTAGKTVNVSGTFTDGGAGRVAGRSAGAVASTPIVAYALTDAAHTALNNAADTTGADGTFSITVNLGSASNADIIIEALPDGASIGASGNIRVGVEDLAANAAGVAADPTTAAEGLLWLASPTESLTTSIKPIVKYFSDEDIDVRATAANATRAASIVTVMKTVHSTCGSISTASEKKTCVINKIAEQNITDATVASVVDQLETKYKIDTSVASQADLLKYYAPDQTDANISAVIEMAEIAGASLSGIDSTSEALEMFSKLEYAITAHTSTASTGLAKKVSTKTHILGTLYADTFTNSTVKDLLIELKAGYAGVVGTQAAALSSSLISTNDMISLVSGYDAVIGMFIETFVKDAGVSRNGALAMAMAFEYTMGKLGETSENNTSVQTIFDDWVPAYADATFRDQLHTLFDPLGMDNRAKTEQLMQLSRDLSYTNGTRSSVESTLGNYLTPATVAEAMTLYDKYYGTMNCSVDAVTRTIGGTNCPTQAEIVHLLETHFEKSLPVLNAVLTDLQVYIQTKTDKFAGLAVLTDIYADMKVSAANKALIGDALEAAGIQEEMFWLAMNLEPYI